MNVEVTVCKHELATGQITGMIYTIEASRQELEDGCVFANESQKCGAVSSESSGLRNIEDADYCGRGYEQTFKGADGFEYRITLIGDEALWDHSFAGLCQESAE